MKFLKIKNINQDLRDTGALNDYIIHYKLRNEPEEKK